MDKVGYEGGLLLPSVMLEYPAVLGLTKAMPKKLKWIPATIGISLHSAATLGHLKQMKWITPPKSIGDVVTFTYSNGRDSANKLI